MKSIMEQKSMYLLNIDVVGIRKITFCTNFLKTLKAKSRKYRGVFKAKSREKTRQFRKL